MRLTYGGTVAKGLATIHGRKVSGRDLWPGTRPDPGHAAMCRSGRPPWQRWLWMKPSLQLVVLATPKPFRDLPVRILCDTLATKMIEVRQTTTYAKWFACLRDHAAKARIDIRIRRLSLGNPGDVKPVGEGVSELRISY